MSACPGLRLPGAVDGFELAVRAILGQQISVPAARTLAGRLAAQTGTELPPDQRLAGITHLFPTPEQVAIGPLDRLGIPRGRAETLRQLAQLTGGGDLDLSGHGDPEVVLDKLLAIPGVARVADDTGAILEHAERWRPGRGYAAMHLWRAARLGQRMTAAARRST